jgi:hypothetical protein
VVALNLLFKGMDGALDVEFHASPLSWSEASHRHEAWMRETGLRPGEDRTLVLVTGARTQAPASPSPAEPHRGPGWIQIECDTADFRGAGDGTAGIPPEVPDADPLAYAFTGCESHPEDLIRKGAKSLAYARRRGAVRGKLLCCCPTRTGIAANACRPLLKMAVKAGAFPLYEVEGGD